MIMRAIDPAKALVATMLTASALIAGGALVHGCATGPAMNDDRFGMVQTGMTYEEVRRMFGTPQETMKFPRSSTEAWDYIGQDTWGYMVDYAVVFGPDGRVQSKIARRINQGADHGK
jgi:outer membrane protein assembly factor BamE (lipoprotein component of BamABCDE complex)